MGIFTIQLHGHCLPLHNVATVHHHKLILSLFLQVVQRTPERGDYIIPGLYAAGEAACASGMCVCVRVC